MCVCVCVCVCAYVLTRIYVSPSTPHPSQFTRINHIILNFATLYDQDSAGCLTFNHCTLHAYIHQDDPPPSHLVPWWSFPWSVYNALSCDISSELSYPALSAIIIGSCLKARANASIAMDSFPGVWAASSWTALAISISEAPVCVCVCTCDILIMIDHTSLTPSERHHTSSPPPYTILVSFTVCCSTHKAS